MPCGVNSIYINHGRGEICEARHIYHFIATLALTAMPILLETVSVRGYVKERTVPLTIVTNINQYHPTSTIDMLQEYFIFEL